jgi:hypothetical protein
VVRQTSFEILFSLSLSASAQWANTSTSRDVTYAQITCTLSIPAFPSLCYEGYKIRLSHGYWRSSTTTDTIYPCIVREICLGGFETMCEIGHKGIMCNECMNDYQKANQLSCIPCSSIGVSLVKSILSLLLAAGLIVTSCIFFAEETCMIVTIVFDYFQVIRILSNFNVYWPNSLAFLQVIMGDIGSIGLTSFTNSCLGILPNIHSVYSQLIIALIYVPCVALLTSLFVLWIMKCRGRKSMQRVRKASFEVLLSVIPLLFMQAMQGFSCYEIEGVYRLIADPSVECWAV